MKPLFIAAIDLKRIARERVALFWLFIGPLIFVTFFGILFRPAPSKPLSVTLINHDADSYIADTLGRVLKADKIEAVRAEKMPANGWALEIPSGASAAMAANKGVSLTLHGSEEETSEERSLRLKIQKALTTIYLQANPGDASAADRGEALEQRLARSQVITIERRDLGVKRHEITAGFQRSVPSYLVMFILLTQLVGAAGIAEERASGRLRRIFTAPVSKAQIVLGKLLGRVIIGWAQMVVMLLFGVFVFKIRWAEHGWVLFGFLTLYALASASLGMLLGTAIRDPDKARTAGVWTAILLSPLGGLWWPLEVVGPTMRKVGNLVPTGWAMESVNSMLAFDAGARDVAPYAAAFVAMMAVTLTLAVRRLRP